MDKHRLETHSVIPEYRVKIYCLFGMLFFLGVGCFAWPDLYEALTTLEMDARTGPRSHRVNVHLVYHREPARFVFNLIEQAAYTLVASAAGLALTWRLLRGRRAFKKGGHFD